MEKRSKKIGGKGAEIGGKRLEDGKWFGSRFWEGLFGGKPAENPYEDVCDSRDSHTSPRRDNANNTYQNRAGDNNENAKFESVRTRGWEEIPLLSARALPNIFLNAKTLNIGLKRW